MKTLINHFKHYYLCQKAVAGVEFALVAIPFLLLIFGIMEGGRLVWAMNGVQYATEETGRYASLNADLPTQSFQTYAEEKLDGMFIPTASLQISSAISSSSGIDFIQIDATYTHNTLLGEFLPGGFGTVDFVKVMRKPVIN